MVKRARDRRPVREDAEGANLSCTHCARNFLTRPSLHRHRSIFHGTTSVNFERHQKRRHNNLIENVEADEEAQVVDNAEENNVEADEEAQVVDNAEENTEANEEAKAEGANVEDDGEELFGEEDCVFLCEEPSPGNAVSEQLDQCLREKITSQHEIAIKFCKIASDCGLTHPQQDMVLTFLQHNLTNLHMLPRTARSVRKRAHAAFEDTGGQFLNESMKEHQLDVSAVDPRHPKLTFVYR